MNNPENTPSATCPTCGKTDCKIVNGVIGFHSSKTARTCLGSGTPATAGGDAARFNPVIAAYKLIRPRDQYTSTPKDSDSWEEVPKALIGRTIGDIIGYSFRRPLSPSPAAPAGDVRDDAAIQRYDCALRYEEELAYVCMVKHTDAKYILFSDHARQHAHDAEEIAKLRERLEDALEALRANGIFHTPIALRKNGGEWDDYQIDAINRTKSALGDPLFAKAAALKREEESEKK